MLKRMRRIGLFVLAIAVVISSAIIASANERSGTTTGSATAQTTASSYVIENKSRNDIKVTIEHYNKDTNKAIYSTDEKKLTYGAKINDYAKALNWTVNYVTVNGTKVTNNSYLELTKDSTVKVYYDAKKTTVDGATTFYDYTIASNDGYTKYESWDQWNQYGQWIQQYQSFNSLGDAVGTNGKLTSGTTGNNWRDTRYQYHCVVNGVDANVWTGLSENGGNPNIVCKGLVKGLDGNGNVVFNYPEPGFFVNEDASYKAAKDGSTRYLRKVYNDKKLQFSKSGDSYKLISVKDSDGGETKAGSDFYPLDKYKDPYESESTGHNFFFGMRYDVTFKLGDYIGPLDYSFTGDDDLWVILDGNKVVIDLGGIHNTAQGKTNLWNDLGLTPGKLTDDQKNQTHTLTILYMERGATASNCTMNFTLPSARISEVTNVPMADLTFNKINSKNEGISGAAFKLVNDADPSEVYTASSYGNEGTVKFDKLKVGNYTLTETMAPDGYVASTDAWKVVVTEENGTAVAKLYNSDGTTEVSLINGHYQIINSTTEEFVTKNLGLNKTANVDDWNERTYDITLDAWSESQVIKENEPVDIVMVFDRSGSMNFRSSLNKYNNGKETKVSSLNFSNDKVYYYVTDDKAATVYRVWRTGSSKKGYKYYSIDDSYWNYETNNIISGKNKEELNENTKHVFYTTNDSHSRLYYLKEAAKQFTTKLNEQSKNSRVSLVTFTKEKNGGNEAVNTNFDLQEISDDNLTSLNGVIDSITTKGGTQPSLGLNRASEILNNNNTNRKKYVILMTDGCPADETYSTFRSSAKSLVDNTNCTLITIGVGLTEDNENLKDAKDFLSEIASKKENSDSKYAYDAKNADELPSVFSQILSSVVNNSISNATVRDYIDPRFEIIDAAGGNVVTADGKTYVEWTNQEIGYGIENSTGWHKVIKVKAKDDYIGGNNVTTNGPESGITVDGVTKKFPQPTVNVKSELFITNKEITIYKGDSIPSDDEILTAVAGKYIGHHGVKKEDFIIEKFTNSELTDTNVTNTPKSDTEYYIKVTYKNLGKPSDESTSNTDGNVSGVESNENYEVVAKNDGVIHTGDKTKNDDSLKDKEYGKYIVHVKSGKLTIVKTLEDGKKATKDTTFTFRVIGPNNYSKDIDVVIKKGKNQSTSEELTGLARGEYTITELKTTDYEQKSVNFDNDETDSLNRIDGMNGKITFGTNTDNKNVINDYQYIGNGVKGKVEFTNDPVITNWKIVKVRKDDNKTIISGAKFALKQNGKVKYTGESDENGYIIWSKGSKNNAMLASGEYILEETEAAEGYAKGDTTWTLKVTDGGNLEYIKDADGKVISPSVVEEVNLYKFTNDVPYELPETGGIGIYWYTVGGMLLMVMAAIVVYRKRYNEYMNK